MNKYQGRRAHLEEAATAKRCQIIPALGEETETARIMCQLSYGYLGTYCMYKETMISYSKLLYEMGQYFLDIQEPQMIYGSEMK